MQQGTPSTPRRLPAVNVRRAAEADAVPLARFAAALVEERLPVLFRRERPPTAEEQVAFVRETNGAPRSALFVAEAAGEIAGMLDFHGHKQPQRAHAGEFGMSVAKRRRGAGVGAQLLDHLLRWAAAEGLRRIELSVFSNNAPAIRLYERAGFVREGVQRDAVEVNGRYVDLVLMARLVSPTDPPPPPPPHNQPRNGVH